MGTLGELKRMELFKKFEIGKYLVAKVTGVLPKTVVMMVINKHHNDLLGLIKWYPPWRQYCYKIGQTWYSESCLRDIADFLHRQNEMHKALSVNTKRKEETP